MASIPSPGDLYTQAAGGLDKYINPDALVASIQSAVSVYMPAAYAIAFVLLTVGTMREFLYPEMRRFFGTLVRTLVLVACMSAGPTLIGWLKNAADALARMPAGVSFSINGTSYSLAGGQAPSLTQLESALQSKVQVGQASHGPASSAGSNGFFDSAFSTVKNFLSSAEHVAWEVLFAIFLLWLLLCKVVIILMLFVQKVVVIGFSAYMPIAIGECAHRSLKGKAVSFFLTFVGVLTWPVGWSLVNAVTMAILKSVPTPGDQNFVTLLVAIVAAIPVFLWILIGYVVAPIYAQKVVTRGGAAIQGFVGTMMSVVGQGSAAVIGGAMGAPAAGLGVAGSIGSARELPGRSSGMASDHRPERIYGEPIDASDTGPTETGGENAGTVSHQRRSRGLIGAGAAAVGAGAAVTKPVAGLMAAAASGVQRFGSAAQFIGHGAAEGAGETSGLEYRAIRIIGEGGRRGVQSSGYQGNRSSFRARSYIDEE